MKETTKHDCPKCGSAETKSFAVANKMGTSSGGMVGVGMGGGGDLGIGGGLGKQRTELAKHTAPPKPPQGAGTSIVLIILLVIAFNFVAVGLMVFISGFIAIPVAIVVTVILAIIGIKQSKKSEPKEQAAYKAAMMKWEHSWICLRCGESFYVRRKYNEA